MLVRVDLGLAAARDHEMQAVRRDRAVEQMMRRARRAAARLELGIAERAHHLLLELRRLAIGRDGHAGREAPGAVRQRLGRGADQRGARTSRGGARKNDAAPEQRAAIDQAVAGDGSQRGQASILSCILATFAKAHDSLPEVDVGVGRTNAFETIADSFFEDARVHLTSARRRPQSHPGDTDRAAPNVARLTLAAAAGCYP